jgi:hypothetical protein
VSAFTATVLPDLAAVRLEVEGLPDGPAPITRTDRNGSRLVRQLPDQVASSGLLGVVDYEPALDGTVRYEVEVPRTNVIANPSYEANVSGWNSGGGRLTLARWTDPTAPEGTYYLRATANVAISTSSGYVYPASSPASGGQAWSAVCYVRPSVTGYHEIQVRGSAAGSYVTPYIDTSGTVCPAGVWTRLEASGVLPAGVDAVVPLIFCTGTMNVGDYFELDAVQLVQEPIPEAYIEGTDVTTVAREVTLAGASTPVLSVPLRPQVRAVAQALLDYDETSTSGTLRHTILEATTPVVILRPLLARAGSLVLRAVDYTGAQALRAVLASAEVVLLRQPTFTGLDLYAAVDQVRIAPITDQEDDPLPWAVSLTFAETDPPAGGLLGAAAWTIDDVNALGVTVAALPALFPTVYDLAVGP